MSSNGFQENPGQKNSGKMKTLKWIFYALLIIVFAADFLVERHHVVFPWDAIPGFSALFGLVTCVAIIRVCKAIGYAWLMKKEDYYD